MRIAVKIMGALLRPKGKDAFEVELPEGSRIADLLREVGYHATHQRLITSAVNGTQERHSKPLCDGDEVTLLLPTSGG